MKQLNLLLRLKILEEEKPLTYSILRNVREGSDVGDVLSATVPHGDETLRLDIMTKGGSKAIEPGQRLFFRVTELEDSGPF